MNWRPGGLWRQPDFLKLWAGQSVSLLGTQVTLIALPLTAVLTLNAAATEMGLLAAVQWLPYLLVGLPAGAWIDRLRRRPIMIWADVARALLLATIPLAAWLGVLSLPHLIGVGFLVGLAGVFFNVAQGSYLPTLVDRSNIVEANGRLALSLSGARIAGTPLAGMLVQALTAPIALAVDALSFAVSALCLAWIRAPEPAPAAPATRPGLVAEVREGLRVVMRHPVLRPIMLALAVSNLADTLMLAVLMLFFTRTLGLEPASVGLVLAAMGPGSLAGSLLAPRVAGRFGPGPALVLAAALILVGVALVPTSGWFPAAAVPLLMVAFGAIGVGNPLFNVTSASLRQAVTPDALLGRVGATSGCIAYCLMPFGGLLGGVLGEWIGLQSTLFVGAAGYVVLILSLTLSAVGRQRALPAPTVMAAPRPVV